MTPDSEPLRASGTVVRFITDELPMASARKRMRAAVDAMIAQELPSKCAHCEKPESPSTPLQAGWGVRLYCSETCELNHASKVRSNLPGAMPVPYGAPGYSVLPKSVADAIQARWRKK